MKEGTVRTNIHHLHAQAQDEALDDRAGEERTQKDQTASVPAFDLYGPEVYFNRELSWLDFNWRVLNEALDPNLPLLERLKFLAITSANLDEFYMIRVAGLQQQIELGVTDLSPDGRTPEETIEAIRESVVRMNAAMSRCFLDDVLPGLEAADVHLRSYDTLDESSRTWC